jgi:hypothetical protein
MMTATKMCYPQLCANRNLGERQFGGWAFVGIPIRYCQPPWIDEFWRRLLMRGLVEREVNAA